MGAGHTAQCAPLHAQGPEFNPQHHQKPASAAEVFNHTLVQLLAEMSW